LRNEYRSGGISDRRAIGIVRVSQVTGREGESFASPGKQRDRVHAACERDGARAARRDGGAGRQRRQATRRAARVAAVEAGAADVIVAAYFDRLVRSVRVRDELVTRVESTCGQVLAIDAGRITNGSAGQWLSGCRRSRIGTLLPLDERRALIRAIIDRVTITPGRGLERIKVDLLGK
jgi:hypothetical protein